MSLKKILTTSVFLVALLSARADFTIQFDYSHDTTGFFTANPQAKANLEAAGAYVASFIKGMHMAAIPAPDPVNGSPTGNIMYADFQPAYFNAPNISIHVPMPAVPADTIIIYPVAADMGHYDGPSGIQANGGSGLLNVPFSSSAYDSSKYQSTVLYRGFPGLSQASGKVMMPWGGFIFFNTGSVDANTGSKAGPVPWYYDSDVTTTESTPGQIDFFTVAVREIGHILGLGDIGAPFDVTWPNTSIDWGSSAWRFYSPSNYSDFFQPLSNVYAFTGPAVESLLGGAMNVVFSGAGADSFGSYNEFGISSHIAGTAIVQTNVMHSTNLGAIEGVTFQIPRLYLTDLDLAALWDIGYEVSYPGMPTLPVASQTISFTQADVTTYETVTLASASSARPVSCVITGATGSGSISGNVLTVTKGGTFTIQATQAGDSHYSAAPPQTQTFTVTLASRISLSGLKDATTGIAISSDLTASYTKNAIAAAVTTVPSDLSASVTYDGSTTPPVNAGTYAVVATITDPHYSGSASATLTITPAAATLTFTGLIAPFTGKPWSVGVYAMSAGVQVFPAYHITFNGFASNPVAAGYYDVVATATGNYTGSASGTLIIAAPPAITLQPVSQTAAVGGTITFSVAVSGAPAPSFRWCKNGVTLAGQTNATLTLPGLQLSDAANYTVVVTNTYLGASHSVTSKAAKLTVLAPSPSTLVDPNTLKTGMAWTFDLSGGVAASGLAYYASNLPAGLKLNPSTGLISGTLSARAGSYKTTYWTQLGSVKSATQTTTFVIGAFPGSLTGGFDALLIDSNGFPSAKVELLVASGSGAFTGKLTTSNTTIYPLKGILSLSPDAQTAAANIGGGPYALTIQLSTASSVTVSLTKNTVLIGATSTGSKRATTGPTGAFTILIGNPTNLGTDGEFPQGTGYATATGNANGTLSISGKLADGTAVKGTLNLDSDHAYRLYLKPYNVAGSYLSGTLQLSARSDNPGLWHISAAGGSDLYWMKSPLVTDAVYPAGFGPIGLALRMEPWGKVSTASDLRGTLGVSGTTGNVAVVISATGLTNEGGSADATLPTTLSLSATNLLTVYGINGAAFTATINGSNGTFAGYFTVASPAPARRVAFAGALLQVSPYDVSGIFGGGAFLLPPPIKPGATLSGKLELSSP